MVQKPKKGIKHFNQKDEIDILTKDIVDIFVKRNSPRLESFIALENAKLHITHKYLEDLVNDLITKRTEGPPEEIPGIG